ncbi:MAG: WbqC family protein [Kofleriaceae bacterium]|nr:WbqC family protein [Kofleriaceae bacterium]MCB9570496.1 WbqC family protein [Kofleriaceae bacterium]
MIVAAHQPSYLPWLGYLDKMLAADVFVVMDDLQYEAQNFQNRNRLKLNQGAAWVTVPLERGTQRDRILDKRIHNGGNPKEHWQRRTWLTIKTHYGKAAHFDRYAPELEELFTRRWDRLVDLDQHVLTLARRWLGITKPILHASSLGLVGDKTDRIIDLCRKVGARVYLSGSGGSTGYLDVDALHRAGISVRWQRFDHPVYPQRYPAQGFVPNLAFLDLILNCGAASAAILRGGDLQSRDLPRAEAMP